MKLEELDRLFRNAPCDAGSMAQWVAAISREWPVVSARIRELEFKVLGIDQKPPEPYTRPSTPQPKQHPRDWDSVDWNRQDVQIAHDLQCSTERVRQVRRERGMPNAPNHRKPRGAAVAGVNGDFTVASDFFGPGGKPAGVQRRVEKEVA